METLEKERLYNRILHNANGNTAYALNDAVDRLYYAEKKTNELFEENKKLKNKVTSLESAQKWIPLGERMPEHDIECLVCDAGLSIFMSMLSEGVWYTDGYAVDVTHWMPLPEPPEVKE